MAFAQGAMDFIQKEMQKLQVLQQNGIITSSSYEEKARYLQEHGAVAEAGVGMSIAERHPFKVIDMRPGGPALKTGVIKCGDELQKVNGVMLTASLTGEQVRALVIGGVGSVVELQFKEMPPRTERGAFRVRLVRQSADQGGTTQISAVMPPPGEKCDNKLAEGHYNDDFDIESAERAIKHQYDPRKKQWARTLINVVVQPCAFAEGAMRQAFHMQDLSVLGDDRRYVLKLSKDVNELTQIYFDDVQMQMEAKMYAEHYNAQKPPKQVDFLDAYVLELKDRSDKPICAVEKYIEGEYKKFNNNWNWSDEHRNTPQAFSHFTYVKSKHTILVCDIQGVGDTWTDPQIHSHDQQGYGKGNMGQEGILKFLESHKCNEICRWLKLPSTGKTKSSSVGETHIRSQPPCTVVPPPRGSAGEVSSAEGAHIEDTAAVQQALREKEQERQEKEKLGREKVALEAELQRIKAEFNAQRPAAAGNTRETDVGNLCAMGFTRAQAESALEHNTHFQDAVEWCLAASAANSDGGGGDGGAAPRGGGPPQRPPPGNPTKIAQGSRLDVDARLLKELKEQMLCNQRDDSVVFAEPLQRSGPGLREWVAVILGPEDSVYEGGAFQLSLCFPDGYPLQPPVVKFRTKIFHPNVWARPDEKFGQICLDILDDQWSPALRVQQVLLSIMALLQSPNAERALDKMVGQMYSSNRTLFSQTAKKWLTEDSFRSKDVRQLHGMFSSTRRIVGALRECSNNLDDALNLLLDESWEPSIKLLLGVHAQHAAVVAASVAENSAAPAAGGGGGAGGSAGAGINASVFNRNVQLHQQNAVQQGVQQQLQQGLQRAQHERPTQALPPAYDQAVSVGPLPEGWVEYDDKGSGKKYYHHAASQVTQWNRPNPLARVV